MKALLLTTTMGLLALAPVAASAGEDLLPGRHPFRFQDTNRASIAALIEQKKGTLSGSGGGSGAGCGGSAGNSTAIQNYTCIIINNSDHASVDTTQAGSGNVTSTTTTDTTTNNVQNKQLSTVLQSLVP